MEDGILPEGPLEDDSVQFQPSGNTKRRAVALSLAMTLASLWLFLADLPSGSFHKVFSFLAFVFFGSLTVIHLFNLVKGKELGGLLVDGDGIVARNSYSPIGRIYWHEIKAVYPVDKASLPGLPKENLGIGLDVTDSYLQRRSAGMRRNVWMSRHVFRWMPDILISSITLKGSRGEILKVLQNGLRRHELRSISEAKELESGS